MPGATQRRRLLQMNRRATARSNRVKATRMQGRLFVSAADHPVHDLGPTSYVCSKCSAYHWQFEQTEGTSVQASADGQNRLFFNCCVKGAVDLPALQGTPPFLDAMLAGNTPTSRAFLKNIRAYNSP